MLDFDDLLLRTRQLLRGPQGKSICQSLAAPLRLLLVDEFQDTDPVQIEIVEALCGNELTRGKLFFVGDSKQSIYRFRVPIRTCSTGCAKRCRPRDGCR